MFKVNNKDTRTTPGVVLVSLLLILNIFHNLSSASIVNFEQEMPAEEHSLSSQFVLFREVHRGVF